MLHLIDSTAPVFVAYVAVSFAVVAIQKVVETVDNARIRRLPLINIK